MDSLDLERLQPTAEGDLERYAAQIQELVLWIRDEGHILSSIDQHLVEQWWEAGYPLDSILHALRESGLRLKNRKAPPRGLPLRSMKRWVVKAGERARASSAGTHEGELGDHESPEGADAPSQPQTVLAALQGDVSASLSTSAESLTGILGSALEELDDIAGAALGEAELFAALLGVGRRYYDARWDALPVFDRSSQRTEVLASLGDAAKTMDAGALEATVAELCRRRLRAGDSLFDPDRYWNAS